MRSESSPAPMRAWPVEGLASFARAATGREDADGEYWQAVRLLQLHSNLDRVFEVIAPLCSSELPSDRAFAADVLAQLGNDDRGLPFEANTVELLLPMLRDSEAGVRGAAAVAFRYNSDSRAVDPLLGLAASASHSDRFAALFGLANHVVDVRHGKRPIRPDVRDALLRLTWDDDHEVRDWATFELTQCLAADAIDLDTPGVRDALWARVTDESEIASEALRALAKHGEPGVLPYVVAELERQVRAGESFLDVVEAAKVLGDPGTLPALTAMRSFLADARQENWYTDAIDKAIAACGGSTLAASAPSPCA